MKNQFSDFYFFSYGWLYLQFTGETPDFQVCHQPKKSFKGGQIYRKYEQLAETNEKLIFRFLFYKLWSILYSKLIEKFLNIEYKNDHIWKTKNRKIDFSIVSAHSLSFM